MTQPLYPMERGLDVQWIGGRMGPRARPCAVLKNFLRLLGIDPWPSSPLPVAMLTGNDYIFEL
jgi:hypothetical protein